MIKGITPKIRRLCFCLNKQCSSGPFLCLDPGVTMLFSGTLSPIMSVQPQRPELLSAVTSPSSASLCPWQPFRWLLQRLVPPNLSQYTFLSYVSYIHNILSCVTFMVAPLIIQQTIFHAASVFHATLLIMLRWLCLVLLCQSVMLYHSTGVTVFSVAMLFKERFPILWMWQCLVLLWC